MNRYVCIHGHFYQPPRENPWTGAIERQPSAGRDHDWNVRIARECYLPNGEARVADAHNKTVALVNNYSGINFNFGPTLLSWLERAHPDGYRKLLEADQESARRLEGHGNAIAQAYNHMILPLASPRDQRTQLRWGLADFKHRFGRRAEALWLPETACDDATLRLLVEFGLKYAILSPSQAQRVRPLGHSAWTDVSSGEIDVRHPYRWFDRRAQDSRHIDVFFYHGPLSHGLAFEKLMSSSPACAEKIAAAFDPHARSSQLVSLCSDGETYGHHEKFAEMGLAHLLKYELPARGIQAVNYGYYLSRHHPAWEVEIKIGPQGLGTSWSCAHGVGRWMEDCGCGSEGGQQKWRKPLRDSLDWLRGRLVSLFEREGGPLLHDVWEARDDYVRAILKPGEHSAALFLARHLRRPYSPPVRETVLRLMELQRHAMLMYTSCGWFFSEISGLEAAQNLKYAARAVELAREASGVDLEPEFLSRLKRAPSNDPQFKDGEGVYRKLVRPSALLAHARARR